MTNPEQDPSGNQNLDLHICPECGSDKVQPAGYEKAYVKFGQQVWSLSRRCAECEWTDTGFYQQDEIEEFEDKHSEGLFALDDDLSDLEKAQLGEMAQKLRVALRDDLIGPDDFK